MPTKSCAIVKVVLKIIPLIVMRLFRKTKPGFMDITCEIELSFLSIVACEAWHRTHAITKRTEKAETLTMFEY